MAEAGVDLLPLRLDPTAQEFRPTSYVYYSLMIPAPIPVLPPSSTAPTRALLLSSVPTHVSESTVRRDLEVFGDVRAVQMERLRDGILTVHFYDLRQATEALNTIQQQHMHQQRLLRQYFDGLTVWSPATPPTPPSPPRGLLSGRVIWAQFAFPLAADLPDRFNQGALIINLDSDVSTAAVRDIFQPFGDVKEISETPMKKNKKYVEFYDSRVATKAVNAVNGQEINGKLAGVEFFRPSGNNINKHIPREVIKPPPIAPKPPYNVNLKKYVYKHQQSAEQRVAAAGGGGNAVRNKPWKGPRYNRKSDPRFSIKGADAVVSSFQDSRTTVMIKNIPNKYSLKLLLNMLDNHCIQCNEGKNQPMSSYDFVYLPIDFVNKCNVGYGFVNMTSLEATWRLYKTFDHQNWEVFNSKKICQVSYARVQGLEALKEHFKNSKFPCESEEYRPVVFSPPRDGRTMTEPMPVVGSSITTTTMTSLSEVEVGCLDLTGDISSDPNNDDTDNLLVEDTNQTAQSPPSVGGGDGDI